MCAIPAQTYSEQQDSVLLVDEFEKRNPRNSAHLFQVGWFCGLGHGVGRRMVLAPACIRWLMCPLLWTHSCRSTAVLRLLMQWHRRMLWSTGSSSLLRSRHLHWLHTSRIYSSSSRACILAPFLCRLRCQRVRATGRTRNSRALLASAFAAACALAGALGHRAQRAAGGPVALASLAVVPRLLAVVCKSR